MKLKLHHLLFLFAFSISTNAQFKLETNFGVQDADPANGTSKNITVFENAFYLNANSDLATNKLHKYDGTNYEVLRTSSATGSQEFTIVGSPTFKTREIFGGFIKELLFIANRSGSGIRSLCTIQQGSSLVNVIHSDVVWGQMEVVNNIIYGTTVNGELYKIDTNNTITILKTFAHNTIKSFFVFDNKIFLSADDTSSAGTDHELYVYDITTDTLVLEENINTTANTGSDPASFTVGDGKLYFTADPGSGREMYVYDPNATSNKVTLINFFTGISENPTNMIYFDNTATGKKYIIASAYCGFTNGIEPIALDLSNNTAVVLSVRSGTSDSLPRDFIVFNNFVYFVATDGSAGFELYRTDGTAANTSLVSDIYTGFGASSTPINFVIYDNELYFSAVTNASNQRELHKITTQNQVVNVDKNFLNVLPLISSNNLLYVSGRTSTDPTFIRSLYSYKATTNFKSGGDGNWETASNWTKGIPTATIGAVIEAPVILASNAECESLDTRNSSAIIAMDSNFSNIDISLTVKNDWYSRTPSTTRDIIITDQNENLGSFMPSLIVEGNLIGEGLTRVNRRQSLDKWHLNATPVLNSAINNFSANLDTGTGNNLGMSTYNNNLTQPWEYYTSVNIASSGNFISGKAYASKLNASSSSSLVTYEGKFENNSVSIPITDGANSNWNLIGNPYTSAIASNSSANSANNLLSENAAELDPNFQALYFWNPDANLGNGAYEVVNQASNAHYTPIAQGFFVNAKTGGGIFNFNKNMQSHRTSDTFLKVTPKPEINILVNNGTVSKSTSIKYLQNTTSGLDIGFDAGSFSGVDSNFTVFTHLASNSQGVNFMLQCVSQDYENTVIPLGLKAKVNTEVTFSLDTNSLPTNINVFLEDKETNTFTNLTNTNSKYKFTTTSSMNGIGRFYVHTSSQSVLNINDVTAHNISIYKKENQLVINSVFGKTYIKAFDMLGKEIFKSEINAQGNTQIDALSHFKTGVYIFKIANDKNIVSKKIIF